MKGGGSHWENGSTYTFCTGRRHFGIIITFLKHLDTVLTCELDVHFFPNTRKLAFLILLWFLLSLVFREVNEHYVQMMI